MKRVGKGILELYNDLKKGVLCLPEFQRDFVWKPQQVADLMKSILRGYPVGLLLFLKYKNNRQIDARHIEIDIPSFESCRFLVLDGQQRLTAIYKVLHEIDKGIFEYRKMYYSLFIDLDVIDDVQIHDLKKRFIRVIGKNEKEKCENYLKDYESRIRERKMPFFVFLNRNKEIDIWKKKAKYLTKKKIDKLTQFRKIFLETYDISYDVLEDKIESKALCNIFRTINSTGTKLNIFDLEVADFETKKVDLRKLWKRAKKDYPKFGLEFFDIDPVYILKIIALVNKSNSKKVKKVTCSKRDIVNLSNRYGDEGTEFKSDWDNAVRYLSKTLDYYSNYGVDRAAKNPYSPMLIVYAAILWWDAENTKLHEQELIEKLSLWYWRSVFLKRYEKSTDSMVADDFERLRRWLLGEIKDINKEIPKYKPAGIYFRNIFSNRDAVYRGVLCLPGANMAKDIWSSKSTKDLSVDDHHIFPRRWLEKKGLKKDSTVVNCVLNRTYILTEKHKMSDKAPGKYFYDLSENIFNDKLNTDIREKLEKHFIDKVALKYIRSNNFKRFLKQREKLIQREIKKKTCS